MATMVSSWRAPAGFTGELSSGGGWIPAFAGMTAFEELVSGLE